MALRMVHHHQALGAKSRAREQPEEKEGGEKDRRTESEGRGTYFCLQLALGPVDGTCTL